MTTFRLVEWELVPHENGGYVVDGIHGFKKIINIMECEGRDRLLRLARKNGIKIRGNKLVEITEMQEDSRY